MQAASNDGIDDQSARSCLVWVRAGRSAPRRLTSRALRQLHQHNGTSALNTPQSLAPVCQPQRSFARRRSLLALALATWASACSPGADLPLLPVVPLAAYRLGNGDLVRIITFGEQQLTGEFRVSDNGNIAVPLLGNVMAAGLTPSGLEAEIARELRQRNLFRDPSVSVEVVAYRPIFVLGQVNRPGQFPYQPGMTVLTAVAIAGGFTYRAVEHYASIVRTTGDQAVEGKVMRQSLVQPGDVVTVFERRF